MSHDSYLVETVADKFWLVNNGEVNDFVGDMRDYKDYISSAKYRYKKPVKTKMTKQIQIDYTKVEKHKTGFSKEEKILKNNLIQLRKKRKEIEKKIENLEHERKDIEKQITVSSYYIATPKAEISSTSKRLTHIETEIQFLEEGWLELSEKIDTIS